MPKKTKIFTYNTEKDKDIHDYLNSLGSHQASKKIREGLRLLIDKEKGNRIDQDELVEAPSFLLDEFEW